MELFVWFSLILVCYWIGFFLAHFVGAHMGAIAFEKRTFITISFWAVGMTLVHALVSTGFAALMGSVITTGPEQRAMARAGEGIFAIETLVLLGVVKAAFFEELDNMEYSFFCGLIAVTRAIGPLFIFMTIYSAALAAQK